MDALTSLWDFFVTWLSEVLPLSPFSEYISYFEGLQFIGYINWFFPFAQIVVIFKAWLHIVVLYYFYSAGMRWAKVMGQ